MAKTQSSHMTTKLRSPTHPCCYLLAGGAEDERTNADGSGWSRSWRMENGVNSGAGEHSCGPPWALSRSLSPFFPHGFSVSEVPRRRQGPASECWSGQAEAGCCARRLAAQRHRGGREIDAEERGCQGSPNAASGRGAVGFQNARLSLALPTPSQLTSA